RAWVRGRVARSVSADRPAVRAVRGSRSRPRAATAASWPRRALGRWPGPVDTAGELASAIADAFDRRHVRGARGARARRLVVDRSATGAHRGLEARRRAAGAPAGAN